MAQETKALKTGDYLVEYPTETLLIERKGHYDFMSCLFSLQSNPKSHFLKQLSRLKETPNSVLVINFPFCVSSYMFAPFALLFRKGSAQPVPTNLLYAPYARLLWHPPCPIVLAPNVSTPSSYAKLFERLSPLESLEDSPYFKLVSPTTPPISKTPEKNIPQGDQPVFVYQRSK